MTLAKAFGNDLLLLRFCFNLIQFVSEAAAALFFLSELDERNEDLKRILLREGCSAETFSQTADVTTAWMELKKAQVNNIFVVSVGLVVSSGPRSPGFITCVLQTFFNRTCYSKICSLYSEKEWKKK